VCVTTAWAPGVRVGGASAVFGRSRMRSLHPVVASSGGKLLTDCNYCVNYVVIKITRVKFFCARSRGMFGGGRGAISIVSIDGGERLALRPGRSAARGINPIVRLRAELDVVDKSFLLKPRIEPRPIV